VAERINEYAALGIEALSSPAIRIWKRLIASASCCSRCWMSLSRRFRSRNPWLQGEAVANEFIPRKVAQS
jgi:hypothetical protein